MGIRVGETRTDIKHATEERRESEGAVGLGTLGCWGIGGGQEGQGNLVRVGKETQYGSQD